MGIFDFLSSKRRESVDPATASHSSSALNRDLTRHSTLSREAKTNDEKKKLMSVVETREMKKILRVQDRPSRIELTFYCPIRDAKIFCHSVLVDKLGDLTKFIILSLFDGRTIEEISALTQMGKTTVNEELDYLIHGGLIGEDRKTLTELGNQYGMLLKKFINLSDGIVVSFNAFANQFEPADEQYVIDPDEKYVLESHFMPVLARNEDFRNSLDIAKEQIEEDTPFCWEIKRSLYTTVKIERECVKYKPISVRDFSKGYTSESQRESCVRIAIPCDWVTYQPRYKWIDAYRDAIPQILSFDEKYDDLLSDKAKLIKKAAKEEDEAETLTEGINTITGSICHYKDCIRDLPEKQPGYILERQPIQLILDDEASNGIYLHEIKREHLYQILYFPYSRMEV